MAGCQFDKLFAEIGIALKNQPPQNKSGDHDKQQDIAAQFQKITHTAYRLQRVDEQPENFLHIHRLGLFLLAERGNHAGGLLFENLYNLARPRGGSSVQQEQRNSNDEPQNCRNQGLRNAAGHEFWITRAE